jgi:signal transduction histidine kinase
MPHLFEHLSERLFSGRAESDEGFRAEVERTSLLSLRAVGALEFAVPLLMASAGLGVIPITITDRTTAAPNLLFSLLGAWTLGAGWSRFGARHARLVTAVSVCVSVVIMLWSAIILTPELTWVEHHIIGYIVLVMFGCASAVPLKPVQTLFLGLAIDAIYVVSLTTAARHLAWTQQGFGLLQHLFTLVVTLLCTALTSSVYRQRYAGYLMHQRALRTSERLRDAEKQLLLSENAATMGRVAAALSHELNSPIGVLTSSVDTLNALARRISTAPAGDQDRLRMVLEDITRSGRESAERLRGIVSRIQRFTNLDRADVQSANVNDLIADVVALVRAERVGAAPVTTDLQDVPHVICRPQQLSAVLSNLLSNALNAVGLDGHVSISTRAVERAIEILIEDDGRGINPDDVATIFDPAAFRVTKGRVAAGNWSLFSSRQIVREHGGDITLESVNGKGTTVRVLLPIAEPAPERVQTGVLAR